MIVVQGLQFPSFSSSILTYIHNKISSVVEFWRWWVLKSKIFGQESTYSKEFFLKNPLMNYGSSRSAKIVFLKSIFDVKKSTNFLDFFFHFKDINFWTTLFSEIMPNFWWIIIHRRSIFFHWVCLFLAKNVAS